MYTVESWRGNPDGSGEEVGGAGEARAGIHNARELRRLSLNCISALNGTVVAP